jgi:prefoldin subunit 5
MTEIDKRKEALDKAARTINAILRLMHKGAMSHAQAHTELQEVAEHADSAEISYCVNEAMKAVEANLKKIQRNTTSLAATNGQTGKSILW